MVFSFVALAVLVFGANSPAVQTLAITFVSITLEAIPFIMLGTLIGGFVEVFISRERVAALLPRSRTLAIIVAGLLGCVIPVCECAVIAVTRRLVRKGVPFSVAVAYLLAGPIVNPLVAGSTLVAYNGDWLVVLARLLCGFAIAVLVAIIVDELFPGHRALLSETIDDQADHNHCGHAGCCSSAGPTADLPLHRRILSALEHAANDFLLVSQFLIIGAFFAAVSQALISRQTFVDLANTPAVTILLMMTLAIVLNLCSEADAFVAASFRTTMPFSAQLAFMVLGPMLDLKLVAMYLSFVRRRALLVLIVLICCAVFGMMMLLHLLGWGIM